MGVLMNKGISYTGGGIVDSALSTTSNNPVANSVVTAKFNQINSDLTELNTFTLAVASWVSNTETATKDAYPYKYTISSTKYTASSTPIWDIIGSASTGILTADEFEAACLIQEAYFTASNIKLYATDKPSVAVKLRVKGR